MMPGKGIALGSVGTARLMRGDLDAAEVAFAEATASQYLLWGPPEGLWGLGFIAARTGKTEDALRYAGELEALARPRAMQGFLARSLWVRALVDEPSRARLLEEAIGLAGAAEERLLLRSLLVLAGSNDAAGLTREIAVSIPDPQMQSRFAATPPL